MLLALVPYALQLGLIIHAIKTGQSFNWIWLLVFLPGLGGLVYAIMVLVPDLRERARHRVPSIAALANPGGEIRRLEQVFEHTPTPRNHLLLARECLRQERWEEARDHIRKLLDGYYRGDRDLALQEALCRFRLEDYAGALFILEAPNAASQATTQQMVHHLYCRWKIGGDTAAVEELGRLFHATGDLECGYLYARALLDRGEPAGIAPVVDEMKRVVAQHLGLRKTMDTRWVSLASRL